MKVLKNYRFSLILLASMVVGAVVGLVMGKQATMFQPVADLFLNMLFTIVVPLIFVALVSSISKMTDLKKLGKMMGIMVFVFIVTQIITSLIMWAGCMVWDTAKGVNLPMNEVVKDMTGNANILGMFTVSDFPLLWSRKNLMALIVAALMVAVGTVSLGEKGKPIVELIQALEQLIMKLVGYIMYIAPIGLAAFFASLFGEFGNQITGPMANALILFFILTAFYFVVFNPVVAFIAGGREAMRRYWKVFLAPFLTAFGTCSSAASIPTNLVAARNAGLSEEVASVAIPLGATLHKDGAAYSTILKICFLASIFKVNMLDPRNIFMAVLISVLASSVMGGIPGGGYVGELFILSAFPFPPVSVPIMILIGTLDDPPATAMNVVGDLPVAMLVESWVNGRGWLQKPAPIDAKALPEETPVEAKEA